MHVAARFVVHVLVGDHVADGEAAAWLEHACGLADHLRLVGGVRSPFPPFRRTVDRTATDLRSGR
jgi:hypothetical protein